MVYGVDQGAENYRSLALCKRRRKGNVSVIWDVQVPWKKKKRRRKPHDMLIAERKRKTVDSVLESSYKRCIASSYSNYLIPVFAFLMQCSLDRSRLCMGEVP